MKVRKSDLNPKLFKDGELRDEVKEKLLDIADEFSKELKESNVPFEPVDIQIVGSNASYNYTKDSDIDLHLIVNTEDELLYKLYGMYAAYQNATYEPLIYGQEVEIYIEKEEENDL